MSKHCHLQLRKAIVTNNIDKVTEILRKSKIYKKLRKSTLQYGPSICDNVEMIKLLTGSLDFGLKEPVQKDLAIAVLMGELAQAKSLLEEGASLQEPQYTSISLFAYVLKNLKHSGEMLLLLFEKGLDPFVRTIFVEKNARDTVKSVSKLLHEEKFVNLKRIDNMNSTPEYSKHFQKCLSELKHLDSVKFYKNYSYYDVLKMGEENIKKLARLMKNKEFVNNFKGNYQGGSYYESDLKQIIQDASKLRDEMAKVEYRLKYALSDCLPDVVIKELAKNLTLKDLPL